MREILFRGKTDNGKWVEGFLSANLSLKKPRYFIDSGKCEDITFSIIPDTVGQYTGLKDKNGKMIFEGDIVSGCNGSINGMEWPFKPHEIKWITDKAEFNVPLWGTEKEQDSTHYIEIIGNIHDNPELLERKE